MSSNGGGQRVRVSPKQQGPLRATVPLSLMQSSCSPNSSPPVLWATELVARQSDSSASPDSPSKSPAAVPSTTTSPGLRGDKCRVIRRTASVDTIYLLGQWQRDALYLSYCGRLMVDRATQTPEEFEEADRKLMQKKTPVSSSETLEMKSIRQRLQQQQQRGGLRGNSPFSPPITIPPKPPTPPRMRNSLEGINQELERIVLREISSSEADDTEREAFSASQQLEPTPEGHRAPIADMFRKGTGQRDTDTQTRSSNSSSNSSSASRPSSNEGSKDSLSPDVEGSSHKLASSPHINKFLAREPPDGCEKVKITEEIRHSAASSNLESSCMKGFILLPSQRSAFDPLCKKCNGDRLK